MLELNEIQLALLYSQIKITGVLMNNRDKHFKIGKTTQPLKDRFIQDQEYQKKYNQIILIYSSTDLKLIDDLEVNLITYYMKNYPTKCDNDQIGGGPDCKGEVGYIYIVI